MFIDKYGLTNSKIGESGAENGLLWTLEHLLLEEKLGRPNKARIQALKDSIEKSKIGQGLYYQNPSHAENGVHHKRDLYMSPDQLIVIMLISKREGWGIHKEIMSEIINQKLIFYNNVKDEETRLIHPRDLALYLSVSYPILGYLLLPLLGIACIIACMRSKEHTSGKLLTWTKINMLNDNIIMQLTGIVCSFLIKRTHGSWENVFSIYFPVKGHPIAELATEVYGGR